MTKVIEIQKPDTDNSQPRKILPLDPATVWNIDRHDPSGRALRLYIFYMQKAIDQNSPQPWAIDSFCARRLGWGIRTVIGARQTLQQAKVIELIRKRRANYIRVHYMTHEITGPSINLQTDKIPKELMGTRIMYDYYAIWFENMKYYKNFPRLQRDVQKKLGYPLDADAILRKMEAVYEKIYGFEVVGQEYPKAKINKVDTELSFYHYILAAVVNETISRSGVPTPD